MEIIRPRLKKADNPYRFYHNYKKKVAFAVASVAASLATGIMQLRLIRSSFSAPITKKLAIANSVLSTNQSMVSIYKDFLGNQPYSFREVYGQKMAKRVKK